MAAAAVAQRENLREPTPSALAVPVEQQQQPSSGAAPAPLKDDAKQGLPPDERLCAICLTEPVEVMLLPCRHAVLCKGCAVIVQREGQGPGDGRCPICRVRVMGAVQGSFEEDYVRLVTAAEARLDWVQGSAYEGMYNNIKPLMVTGALTAAGSVACFLLLPPPLSLATGMALAGTSFVVGYLPWFVTTAGAFEAENLSGAQGSSLRLFSSEDLSRPFTCLAKSTMVAVTAPVAVVVFFGPYVCYAYMLRPMLRYMVQGTIRGSCFSYVYVVRPACKGVFWACTKTCQGLGVMAKAIYDYVLAPSWWAVSTAAREVYLHVLLPGGRRAWAAIAACASALARGARHGAVLTWTYVLSPACDALVVGARAAGNACGVLCHGFLDYVMVPVAKGVYYLCTYVLMPLGRGLGTAAVLVYRHALVPCAHGLAAGAVALYVNVLVPGGRLLCAAGAAVAAGAGAVAQGVAAAAGAVYGAVLVPVGMGLHAAGSAVYHYVLVPAGNGLQAVVVLVSGGAWLVYDRVLRPVGTFLGAAMQAVAGAIVYAAGEGAALAAHVGSQVAAAGSSAIHATSALFQEMVSAWNSMMGMSFGA